MSEEIENPVDLAWCLIELLPEAKYLRCKASEDEWAAHLVLNPGADRGELDYATLSATWTDERTIPTWEAIQQKWDDIQAVEAAKAAMATARSDMRTIFNGLSDAAKRKFYGLRRDVEVALDSGDVGIAQGMVEDVLALTPEEIVAKAQLLALFPGS